MEPLGVYNNNYKLIQSIYSSRLKIQILLSVAQKPCSLSELRDVTGSTSQAIIPKIRSLERMSLLESCDHGYCITIIGKILAPKIEDFVMATAELTKHRNFWATHDMEGIPEPFLARIGDLYDSEVKFDTTENMFHVYTHFISILQQAEYIHSISSVMSVPVAEVIAQRIIAGFPVELVVNRSVAEGLMQEPFISGIRNLKPYKHFKIWTIDEPLHLGITVTDKALSLGLNKIDNAVYDSSADLFSSDRKAREWAERMFEYYRSRSVLFEIT